MIFIKTYYDEKGLVRIDDDSISDLRECLEGNFEKYFGKSATIEFIENSIEFLKNHAKDYWINNPKAFGLEFEGNNGELLNFQFSNPIRKISMSNNGVK